MSIRLLALVALLATACAAPSDLTAPAARAGNLVPITASPIGVLDDYLRTVIEEASEGLLYTSESDYPFEYFTHAGTGRPATAPLSATQFAALYGVPAGKKVQVISLDQFFARHIERADPADSVAQALKPRYIALRETLRTSLAYTVVYRVGSVAIECYIVGFDGAGNLRGLETISIET